MGEDKNLVPAAASKLEVTISDPRVITLSDRWGWKPQTVVERVKESLPAPIEQQAYLELASGFGIQPESFAKILRGYLGDRELAMYDLDTAKGIATEVFTYVLQTMDLIHQDRKEWEIGLSIKTATKLVMLFGEKAVEVVDDIFIHASDICQLKGWQVDDHKTAALALNYIIEREDEGFVSRADDILAYFEVAEIPPP